MAAESGSDAPHLIQYSVQQAAVSKHIAFSLEIWQEHTTSEYTLKEESQQSNMKEQRSLSYKRHKKKQRLQNCDFQRIQYIPVNWFQCLFGYKD